MIPKRLLLLLLCVVLVSVWELALVGCAVVDKSMEKYLAYCEIEQNEGNANSVLCMTALFSSYANFTVKAPVFYFQDNMFCKSFRYPGAKNIIAVVPRGECAFDTKSRIADELGFAGLVIVNNDESLIPLGSQDTSYTSKTPVMLVGKSAAKLLVSEPQAEKCLTDYNSAQCAARPQFTMSYGSQNSEFVILYSCVNYIFHSWRITTTTVHIEAGAVAVCVSDADRAPFVATSRVNSMPYSAFFWPQSLPGLWLHCCIVRFLPNGNPAPFKRGDYIL
jgi:hypothetical protein